MRYYFIFCWFSVLSTAQAQRVTVTILPTLNELPIEPGKAIVAANDTIVIEKLQFYLSAISVSDSKQSYSFGESAKLIIVGNDNLFSINTSEKFVPAEFAFTFGTDSLTNCSGIMGGDLDPALGMYWAWQSGYINFKLEGTSSAFHGKNNSFRFHLGGYHRPFGTAQKVILPAKNAEIVVQLPLDDLFAEIRKDALQTIMRPCEKGSELFTFVAGKFRLQ